MVWLIVAGLAAGILSGMGMGGGTVFIPILTEGLGIPQHAAQWLNLVAFVPAAVVSICIHARNRLLDAAGFWWLLIPSALAAVVCALLAMHVSGRILRLAFGCFLTLTGVIGFARAVKEAVDVRRRDTPHEPPD